MARLSQEKINEIRQSVDIVDVIGQYLALEKKGRNYMAVCPFHDDTHPSMSVSPDKQIFMCFYRLDLDIIICHCNHTGMDFLKFGVKHIIQCTVLVLLRFSIIPVLYRTVISGNSTVNLCFLSTFRTGKVLTT